MNQSSRAPADAVSGESKRSAALTYRFENVVFDEAAGQLWVDDQPVAVEPRPLRLLAELLQHVNEVVTKDELFESVWEGRPTVDGVLTSAVNRLRKALGEQAARRIVNLARVGYRLDGPVECVAREIAGAEPPAFEVGTPVPGKDNYLFVRPLSEAADCAVWLVRHAKLGNEQVLKFGFDTQSLRALKREFTLSRLLRETLGADQQVAVPLSDANFAQSPFYLEMEYGGPNLRDWAEAEGRLRAMPLPQRLALFVQIAKAVAAAHSVGVLHKDLKPTNVLISGKAPAWVAKLTDFGSGRALDPERLKALGLTALGLTQTQMGDAQSDVVSGTPLYLAPEQIQGAPATLQSDVYALGVMLYQLAAGDLRRPMVSGWQRDVQDNDLLVQDILAATDGDPQRRLSSAVELADRVERLEQRQQLQAEQQQREAAVQAAAAEERLQAQGRRARRPWLVAASASLLLGLVASMYFQWQSRQALLVAQGERERAAAISNFLQRDLLESPDILTMGSVRPATMLQLLRRAAESASERFAGRPVDEGALRRRLAEAFMRIASLSDASVELIKARALLEGAVAPDDTELLIVHFLAAHLSAWSLDFPRARKHLETGESLAGPSRLAQASELAYHAVRARHELYYNEKRMAEALPNVERLVAIADVVYAATPHQRADARQRKAEVLHFIGNTDGMNVVLAELRGPPFFANGRVLEFNTRKAHFEAEQHVAAGNWAQALAVRKASREELLNEVPRNDYFLAWLELVMADDLHALGNFAAAQTHYEAALRYFLTVVGEDHQYVNAARAYMGFNLAALGRGDEALQVLNKAHQWSETVGKGVLTLVVQLGKAVALLQLQQPADAAALLDGLAPSRYPYTPYAKNGQARINAERARALLALGRKDEAIALLAPSIAALERANSWPWLIRDNQRLLAAAQGSGAAARVAGQATAVGRSVARAK